MPALTTIKLRRGDAAEWAVANPVLAAGEEGHESDTGLRKVGDGTTAWADLDYFNPVPPGTYPQSPTPGTPRTAVVTATDQTVDGVKTFSSAPVVPDASFAPAKVTGLVTDLAWRAVPRGPYSPATAYVANDIVTAGGSAYRALVASTGVTPGTDALKWEVWGAAGAFALQSQVFPYVWPIITATSIALGTAALTAISGTNVYMEPTDFAAPSGYGMQCRLISLYTGAAVGDLIGADIFDTGAAVVVVPETQVVASSTGLIRLVGDWATFPTVLRRGSIRAVNRTAARGSIRTAWLEIQAVAL